ncbi:hypothetical protein CDL12_26734 [Handroanthus impetiginosus]|uniref:DUF632 domain-containing protein n=1 Tax=Handroanthus impetiginosus TaxID=429701 RepID=A0A2G9G624_9LAMI|nr:hypothetical protein CDL12_26734 [Handroanthus impetiginosus]
MGCTASKLDNEDTVRRCKERRRLMKEAVHARHHLAAAHSDYCRSLRITGSALVTFASGEPLSVSHHTPPVLLRTPSSSTTTSKIKIPNFNPPTNHNIPSPSPSPSVHPPSPPPPISTPSSHQHQPTPPPPIRRKKPVKVPHILSDSSFTSSPPHNFTYNARANSTYSTTPSQASSVWNWDNFYPPPSPPSSEYFQQLQNNKNTTTRINDDNLDDDRYTDNDNDDKASTFTSYSNVRDHEDPYQNPFSSNQSKQSQFDDRASNYSSYSRYSDNSYARQGPAAVQKKGSNLKRWESEEEEAQREEVQCSEWEDHDHYSSTTSSSDEDEREDLKSRSDYGTRSNFGSVKNEAIPAPAKTGNINVNANSKFSMKSEKLSSEDDGKSSVSWGDHMNNERVNSDRRIVVRHKDLAEIVAAIREYFDKAAAAGEQVSEMLETGRAQLDRSFKQLKKTVYHSSGMLSNLSSSWTSKPPLAVKYRFEPSSIEQPGGPKSLWSTLERLLAWEKKLYEEVKAREGVKIEHEKKLSLLQSQEYRGGEEAKLDKTKASIKRLQSLIVVTSQAVSTTSSAIIGLRDSDLVPQLVELCHGFMYMWRSMNQFHEVQNDIVQQVRGLVNHAAKGESTSDLHKRATRDLESAVSAWHSSFCRLIKFQRDFVQSLHGWFKLTLLPVNSEPTNRNMEISHVFAFCDEWKLALDRIPDTVASEAIKSFINVVHSISLKQSEELKIKKRTESASKELEKKASSLRNIEKKYYHSYSMVGIGLPDTGPDNGHVLDARDPLAEKKAELTACQRRVEDEMLKHAKAVEVTRSMTLNNIQTGLPGVFQAMTSFSALITEALETVCTRSYSI